MEKAFTVKKDSELWNNYFTSKKEEEKAIGLANSFFKDCNLKVERYRLSEMLSCDFSNSSDSSKYLSQLKKYKDKMGLWQFKKNSALGKKWGKDVVLNIDKEKLNAHRWWWHKYVTGGEYAMWYYKGKIYGFLSTNGDDKIELSDQMEEIKISEYYRAVEEWEEEQKDENNIH